MLKFSTYLPKYFLSDVNELLENSYDSDLKSPLFHNLNPISEFQITIHSLSCQTISNLDINKGSLKEIKKKFNDNY